MMIIKVLIDNISKNNLLCEWGLSIYIAYNDYKILLDTGASGNFVDNAAALGVDIEQIDFGVLSHAHYDHADGMARFFEVNKKAPFYIRKGTKENCYDLKGDAPEYIGIQKGYLEKYRDRIIYVSGDYEIVPGVTLLPHKGLNREAIGVKVGMYLRENGQWQPDGFDHEQSLVFDTDRGLIIFNSCSHGGADQIIREVSETYPNKNIYALIGGLHLYASPDEEVRGLARRIKETGIQKVYTGHCTGEHAMVILKEELGEIVEQIYTGMEIL